MQGAAALNLAHVAAGRLDGYIAAGPHGWDVAAGVIIVREAGGQVTDFSGGPRWLDKREIVAGPPDLHRQLTKLATG
jgi:myo-inositol-1(or 4)-monophosphatase